MSFVAVAVVSLVLGYLAIRAIQAVSDFRAGKVLVRKWLIVDRSDLLNGEIWNTRTVARYDEPLAFWLWTIGQAVAMVAIAAAFVALIVLS